MAISMNKELLIRMPESLYVQAKKICSKEYKSMSAFVRDLLVDRINDHFSAKEAAMLERSRKEFKEGKGVSWRSVKRG